MTSGKSLSGVVQALNNLCRQGVVVKIRHGLWGETLTGRLNVYDIVPYLTPGHRAYVSFLSALHLYGIIGQIPRVITVASTAHTRQVKTALATYSVHQIARPFFRGFDWDAKSRTYLIAEPEKALADCLYLSGYRKNQYAHFPELEFPRSFKIGRLKYWLSQIPNAKVRRHAETRMRALTIK